MRDKKTVKGIYENTIYNRHITTAPGDVKAITYNTAFPDLTNEYYENEKFDDWYFIGKNQIIETNEREYSDDFLGTNNSWAHHEQRKKKGWFR